MVQRTTEVAANLVAQVVRKSLRLHPSLEGHDLIAEQSSTARFATRRLYELRCGIDDVNGVSTLSHRGEILPNICNSLRHLPAAAPIEGSRSSRGPQTAHA